MFKMDVLTSQYCESPPQGLEKDEKWNLFSTYDPKSEIVD